MLLRLVLNSWTQLPTQHLQYWEFRHVAACRALSLDSNESNLVCFHFASKMNKDTAHQAQNMMVNQAGCVLEEFPIKLGNTHVKETLAHLPSILRLIW